VEGHGREGCHSPVLRLRHCHSPGSWRRWDWLLLACGRGQVIEARELSGDSVRKHSETEFRKGFFTAVPEAVRDGSLLVRTLAPPSPLTDKGRPPAAAHSPVVDTRTCFLRAHSRSHAYTHQLLHLLSLSAAAAAPPSPPPTPPQRPFTPWTMVHWARRALRLPPPSASSSVSLPCGRRPWRPRSACSLPCWSTARRPVPAPA
jgi:hypothetical protein